MEYIAVPVDLIYNTPNDMELGGLVRNLFFETKTGDSVSEHVHHEIKNDSSLNDPGLQPFKHLKF